MLSSNFVMVRRDHASGSEYHVVYSQQPRFSIEVDPAYNPLGKAGQGFIKRIRINNSWNGDYHRCLALVRDAEEFYRQAILERGHRQ